VDASDEDRARLVDALADARARAIAAWPALTLPLDALVEDLAARVDREDDPVAALLQLNVEELALAIAWARKDPAALAVFESHYASDMRRTLEQLGFDHATVDEAEQSVREMLFVGRDGARPGILGFGGFGRLRGWLRVVVSRAAFRLARDVSPVEPQEALEAIAGDDDFELSYLKRTYARAFESAFHDELARLSASDRLLLKQRFQHGMTVTELGRLHGVHASTISRRVTDVHTTLVGRIRKNMTEHLGLGAGEVSSIFRLIQSQIAISLISEGEGHVRKLSG
jgi:RNA polymerase sigma-70 factor (ECF subfamily)